MDGRYLWRTRASAVVKALWKLIVACIERLFRSSTLISKGRCCKDGSGGGGGGGGSGEDDGGGGGGDGRGEDSQVLHGSVSLQSIESSSPGESGDWG